MTSKNTAKERAPKLKGGLLLSPLGVGATDTTDFSIFHGLGFQVLAPVSLTLSATTG